MQRLSDSDEAVLHRLAEALVDQHAARVVVRPQRNAAGFWFGGGNMVSLADGSLLLVGRYRNAGDSRLGVAAGERGLELAIFRADGVNAEFEQVLSLKKEQLTVGQRRVLSIEGAALHLAADGACELFVSIEKAGIDYPAGLNEFLKPGAGVWTIDRIAADSFERLADASLHSLLDSNDPRYLHVKDPSLYDGSDGMRMLLFCSHPYCWTSSNSGYALLQDGGAEIGSAVYDFFPRGPAWDVAITRVTCVCDVPRVGRFRDRQVSLVFYDGGECLRDLDHHTSAVVRPRGYSCEELGGVAYVLDGDFKHVERLSRVRPSFVSPWGTGCSRYVDVLKTPAGLCATWQQSQADGSQPLVMNFVPADSVEQILA